MNNLAKLKKTAILTVALTGLCGAALAQDRTSVGSDIVINQGDTARNVVCVLCSVYVHGEVTGNIAVVLGSVTVDGTVDQRVAIVMGNLKVRSTGLVERDTAIAMGSIEQDKGARLEGRVATVPTGPVLAMLLLPLVILIAAIWLLIRLLRRRRLPKYPMPPPPRPASF